MFLFNVRFLLDFLNPPPPPLVWDSKKERGVSFFFSSVYPWRTVFMRRFAPGAIAFLNGSTLCFLSHPGAISPMGAFSPMGLNRNTPGRTGATVLRTPWCDISDGCDT